MRSNSLPNHIILQLACYSNANEWLVDEYDIPTSCQDKVAKLLGYNSSSELTDSYPVSLDQAQLIARICQISLNDDYVSGDYSWFVDVYGSYSTEQYLP